MRGELERALDSVGRALKEVEQSVAACQERSDVWQRFCVELSAYVGLARTCEETVDALSARVADADQILHHELDKIAGTEDLSVLIELLERRKDIERKVRIDEILDSLKALRKQVDQFSAHEMLDAISDDLSAEVMKWYGRIRTTGDPDVHFGGFDIERTAKGELKARRVQVKARSYTRDLVSAVSSLSESKLNALGLCVSIATNVSGDSCFGFLLIDDPIQSWDLEHETQFIEVLGKLIEEGKQVILMSHNKPWVEMVRNGCRSLDGWYYEFSGYTEAGPFIQEVPWAAWAERLRTVDAVAKDVTAGCARLQQAEEEIRIVVADLASELYFQKAKARKSAHSLNSAQVRKMLVECGVEAGLVDRITETFVTTHDAHHAGEQYTPSRERLGRYHSWAHELARLVEK